MNTWPISIRRDADRVYLGIPDYLGASLSSPVLGTTPSLEEVAGEEWTADVLRVLLPADRVWAWCTQSSIYRRSGLPTTKAPPLIEPSRLASVVSRCRLFHPSILAFVPATVPGAQETVLKWAGVDTEQIPDHIWVSPAGDCQWTTDQILDWCEDPAQWTKLASVAQQPAERLLVLFDRQISCSLLSSAADTAWAGLVQLATRWQLSVVEGRAEAAWVAWADTDC